MWRGRVPSYFRNSDNDSLLPTDITRNVAARSPLADPESIRQRGEKNKRDGETSCLHGFVMFRVIHREEIIATVIHGFNLHLSFLNMNSRPCLFYRLIVSICHHFFFLYIYIERFHIDNFVLTLFFLYIYLMD